MQIKILLLAVLFIEASLGQPWTTRFADYDYQPVPISPTHFSISVPRRPIRMLASPRYRPDAGLLIDQSHFIEDPLYQGPTPHVTNPQHQIASAFGATSLPDESTSEVIQPRPAEGNSVSNFMSRLATTIPEIAEKMAKMTPLPSERPKFNAGLYTFAPPEATDDGNMNENSAGNDFLGNVKKSGLGMFFVTDPNEGHITTLKPKTQNENFGSIVNSMPLPSSLFSFNKLFSAFTPTTQLPPTQAPVVDNKKIYDMRQIKGTPILKDEDETSEVIQKPDEFVSAAATSTEAPNPAENLLGTLLSGKIDQVDWIGAIFNKNSIPEAGEQNPLTQIFKGGFFGSGLDDDVKITKSQDSNFH